MPVEGDWVVSQAGHGKRRTRHKVGSCWRVPGLQEAEAVTGAASGLYENVCGDCFKEPPAQAATTAAHDAGNGGTASSSDSSSGHVNPGFAHEHMPSPPPLALEGKERFGVGGKSLFSQQDCSLADGDGKSRSRFPTWNGWLTPRRKVWEAVRRSRGKWEDGKSSHLCALTRR